MLAFSFLRRASLSLSLFSSVFSIPLKKKKINNTNESASSAYNFSFIQGYITDTFTKPERIVKKIPSTTLYQVSIKLVFMLKRALKVPKYAYAKYAYPVTIRKKLL